MRALICFFILFLAGCAGVVPEEDPSLVLKPVGYEDLPGWQNDNFKTAIVALERSCERIKKKSPDTPFGVLDEVGSYVSWQGVCLDLMGLDENDDRAARLFLERHFTPYEARAGREAEGLFTGYYEASLKGSKTRQGPYRYPLHTRPDDLVMVNLGEFREDLKGRRIAGRVTGGNLKPYEARADIVAGNWPHNDKVMVWVDDPVDAFFVQIQGSGVVELDTGEVMRIGYAGQNGHPYYAIGRELVKREYMDKDEVSMQSIRGFLAAHPDEADEIMNTNRSYVFFHELEGEKGPLGAENVVLTPGRSLAVDHTKIPYGVPVWVDIEEPVPDGGNLQRLMIAQDTGGAIRGAVRGDVFWGYGERAEYLAGHMKSQGRYWLLLPR